MARAGWRWAWTGVAVLVVVAAAWQWPRLVSRATFPGTTPGIRGRPEAYEEYLRGGEATRSADVRRLPEAMAHYRQAVALDPGLAPAWGHLAATAAGLAFLRVEPVRENAALARVAARRALAIDPREGSAHVALGVVELYLDWNFEAARAEVEQAVALSPHDVTAHHSYADYLMLTGRLDDSLEQVRRGRDADPASAVAQAILLFHTAFTGRADAVRSEARLTRERFPQLAPAAHGVLGSLLWREGKHEAALAEYEKAMDDATYRAVESAYRRAGPRAALVARAEALARQAASAGRGADLVGMAECYAEAGEADRAFALLDEACAARAPQLLHVVADPAFDGLRSDARYGALLRRIGVPAAGAAR
jgi:tetratricopeptide (TPR) repeat protein